MSSVSERASIIAQLTSYASVDSSGMGNIIGAGVNILPLMHNGMTPRFTLFTEIHVPADLCPCEVAIEYSLRDENGKVVEFSAPVPQPLRIANIMTIDAALAGLPLDQRNHVGAVSSGSLDFPNGLALSPGNYMWHVTLDGDDDHSAKRAFCVPRAASAPVIG
jgi:hypothetical protein